MLNLNPCQNNLLQNRTGKFSKNKELGGILKSNTFFLNFKSSANRIAATFSDTVFMGLPGPSE